MSMAAGRNGGRMAGKTGKVYLVGAGPGDPGLLTVKGQALLAMAEVLVYDRLASPALLELAPEGCENIYVGKESGRHTMRQEEINQILVEKAGEGKLVVRLKGGDPFVFGRGGEEILELERHGISYEVVPGVTSAIAAPSHVGIPVTHRQMARSFHVVTGHTADGKDGESILPEEYREYAKLPGTLVFLMGLSNLEQIVEILLEAGKPPETPAAVICSGTLPEEACVRTSLRELPAAVREAGLEPPGIIVVGETAALQFCQKESLPLSGISVGLTGTEETCGRLSKRLALAGARPVRAMVSKVKKENEEKLSLALGRLQDWDWILFTSRNGVQCFFEAVGKNRTDLRAFGGTRFAVVGQGTREALEAHGFHADYIPGTYTTKALGEGLCRLLQPDEGKRALLARAKQGSEQLPEILRAGGWDVTDLAIYDIETEAPRLGQLPGLQYLVFASGSGVRGFFKEEPEEKRRLLSGTCPVCIGPETAKLLSGFGVEHFLTAKEYTVDGIVKAILEDKDNGSIRI